VHTYLKKKPSGGFTNEILPGQSEIYPCTWGGGKLPTPGSTTTPSTSTAPGDPSATGLFDVCPGGSDAETNGIFRNNLVVSNIPNVLGDVATANNRSRDYNLYYYTGGTFTDASTEAAPNGAAPKSGPDSRSAGSSAAGRPRSETPVSGSKRWRRVGRARAGSSFRPAAPRVTN
jgi:hypothetical protein